MILQPARAAATPQIIRAACDAARQPKDVVYVHADKVGDLYQVTLVNIDSATTVEAIGVGVIRAKRSATVCEVQLGGLLDGVYTGLTPGRRLFVDTSGRLSESPPSQPISGRRLSQRVAFAMASDVIFVAPAEPIGLQA